MSNIEDEPPPVLLPCTICTRTFKPEVLERHAKVCEKTASKKRRVFDSFRSRVSGTELEEFFGPAPLPGQAQKRPSKSPVKRRAPSKWKETHENLIATLRAARGVELPPETAMDAPKHAGNEQCPSCNRFFGPRAFDRHVEFCKEKTARIKLTPSKVSQAQERLEARTKYRAPLSMKPKLTTKEKYSPMLSRKESVESCTASSAQTSPPLPALSRNLKPVKTNASNFSRQSPIRSSERQRSVSPTKKTSVSSSKSNSKSEALVKSHNQPKIKENLRTPGDIRPKTGSKASMQEKIRSSNPKLSSLEDTNKKVFKKTKNKKREKNAVNSSILSDSESIGTVDSEKSENFEKQQRNKWSSTESIGRGKEKPTKTKSTAEETEKVALDLGNRDTFHSKAKEILKSGKKTKQQKLLINDLSVNDESFGIFVAACSVIQPTSSASKTSVNFNKESPEKPKALQKEKTVPKSPKIEERKSSAKVERKIREHPSKKTMTQKPEQNMENVISENFIDATAKDQKSGKTESKISKIPKPKSETVCKIPPQKTGTENFELVEVPTELLVDNFKEPEIPPKVEEEISQEESIKKKSRKWRNITEIPTEDLVHMSEDLCVSTSDKFKELSESVIWDIAAEQFLQSGEPTANTSAFSVDSLNENDEKKKSGFDLGCKKSTPGGDDLIVLHVTDPSKLVENDADMKLSISEPCFPYSNTVQKPKEKPLAESKKVDIVVFTASPNAIQSKITHRKRQKQRKLKKQTEPEMLCNREKTFLANDIPKAKRRKLSNQKLPLHRAVDFGNCCFGSSSKKEMEERKKKFIEGLKNQREKIRKWQITANSHIRFMEEFEKGIEDDLKELKNLAKDKKTRRKPNLKEFKKEKMKVVKDEHEKINVKEKQFLKPHLKKFEYFEISLTSDDNQNETCTPEKDEETGRNSENKERLSKFEVTHEQFKCFEITNHDFCRRSIGKNVEKTTKTEEERNIENVEETEQSPRIDGAKEKLYELDLSFSTPDSVQTITYQNSSLENIEEVDESAENEESFEKNIEIEDFIMSKPDSKKIFSKQGNFLEELFPKPRKIAEIKTSVESTTAVQLGFSADSVYDLKSNKEKRAKASPLITSMSNPTRILQKRIIKEPQLPQILVQNIEQKENSMISLIEMWKIKKGSSESKKAFKTKGTLPTGKLPPLTNKNSFQIATDSNDSYDPFKQAERQMLALLSWPSTVDIKLAKSLSPSPKSKSISLQISNLETSPTSAFTKYPNKDDKAGKNEKNAKNARRNLNETFAMNETSKKNISNEKPTYTSADDWEQIFEKHCDLNRNEMLTDQVTRSVKSALDGLLKSTMKNNSNMTEEALSPEQNELTDGSIITEALYTSTPKQNSKSDKSPKPRSKENIINLDQTPNTYRKISDSTYDGITPPEDLSNSLGKTKKNEKTNRNSGISLSSLSFCSQISDTTLADEEVMRSNLEIIGKAAAAATGRTPRRKYARSQSVFDERNKMLFAKTYDPNCSSSDENDTEVPPKIVNQQRKKSPSRNPNPKSSLSYFYRSRSVIEDRCKGDGEQHSEDGDQVSSPESNRNRKAKLSGDSAYSSLNRRSPRQTTQHNHHEDRLSSSGSEQSLPIINDHGLKPKALDFENAPPSPKKEQPPVKMSKFCHECGSKYPVAVAKFCCECGVRRLII